MNATENMLRLIDFAVAHGLVEDIDRDYTLNRLMEAMRMNAPEEAKPCEEPLPPTVTPMLHELTAIAAERGLIADTNGAKELFATKLCGEITPAPAVVRRRFSELYESEGPEAATKWFYELCRACDYIKVDSIARNVRFFQDSPAGELEITINLSKPEKDPRDIAAQRNAPKVGYPLCMLCAQNPGYAGRLDFPARQNHRMIPLALNGERWYLQYSPYLYYSEHCIVLNEQHRPMRISENTFDCLFDFVEQFPHYLIGSNADLPIVGGSILSHDHFQGGNYTFPMDHAGTWISLTSPDDGVAATVLDWPLTCVNLKGADRNALKRAAMSMLNAWRAYSDPACGILAQTDAPHNTITPVRKLPDGRYQMHLVLRNNRTSAEHPLGIFHPHANLHHIKKENIGLIEVMGLFILPGRLLGELTELSGYLTGKIPLDERPAEDSPILKHYEWVKEIAAKTGCALTQEQAVEAIHEAMGVKCAAVLADAGVYKHDANGRAGVLRFLNTIGYKEA